MLTGEARLGTILVHRRRADGQRPAERFDTFGDLVNGALLPSGYRFDDRTGKSNSRRDWKTVPDRLPQPDRLRAKDRSVERLFEWNDFLHSSTVTSPALPSTRTRTPSAMRSVASRVPTTPGIPYSRATIAECESRPPRSVTIAPSNGRSMLNASVVDS